MGISIKEINKQIDELKHQGEDPKSLVIGYKTYANLMNEDKFAEKITKDPEDPMIRYYKGIRVKIVTEKRYFSVK